MDSLSPKGAIFCLRPLRSPGSTPAPTWRWLPRRPPRMPFEPIPPTPPRTQVPPNRSGPIDALSMSVTRVGPPHRCRLVAALSCVEHHRLTHRRYALASEFKGCYNILRFILEVRSHAGPTH